MKFLDKTKNNLNEIAFVISTSAVLSSYILSQVAGLEPCTLCWYQRILMFPLPFIFGGAVLRNDKQAFVYTLPLSIIGMIISFYHSLLQWGIINLEVDSCSLSGPSCGTPEILLLGFLTIPFGSFLIFSSVSFLMYLQFKQNKKQIINPNSISNYNKIIIILGLISVAVMFAIKAINH